MLSKKRRISRSVMEQIRKGRSQSFFNALLSLQVYIHNGESLFSCSSSKKNLKQAVERNLFRRRVYEAIYECIPRIQPNIVCVFSLKKKSLKAPSHKLISESVTDLLTRGKILRVN